MISPDAPAGGGGALEALVLDVVYLLVVAVLAFVVGSVGRGVEKL